MHVGAYPHEAANELFKALSEPTRIRVLSLLASVGELCGCDVEATLQISQTRASRALTTLRRAGLVVDRRDGAWVHYSVAPNLDGLAKVLVDGLMESLRSDPVLESDRQNLQRTSC